MTRLERLEQELADWDVISGDGTRWALAMLREAEQELVCEWVVKGGIKSCTRVMADGMSPAGGMCPACSWKAKLREEA